MEIEIVAVAAVFRVTPLRRQAGQLYLAANRRVVWTIVPAVDVPVRATDIATAIVRSRVFVKVK